MAWLSLASFQLAQATASEHVSNFVFRGGIFMIFILLCSLVAVAVIIHRFVSLRWNSILPQGIIYYIERVRSQGRPEDLAGLGAEVSAKDSPLARMVSVAFEMRDETSDTMRSGVEAAAREEIGKLQNGLPVLEVIITIAPLLGLLGTVSGLISVFGVVGESNLLGENPAALAAGIAEALYTTIGGLAVAVPVVIAHSYFSKKIEGIAARSEVLLTQVMQAVHALYQRGPAQHQGHQPSQPAPTLDPRGSQDGGSPRPRPLTQPGN